MTVQKKVLGVIGSGSNPYAEFSIPLGYWIAEQGFHLVNGGGGGVMEGVARGYQSFPGTRGMVLGILPASAPCTTAEERSSFTPQSGYPNPYINIPIRTHLPLSGSKGKETGSRNHIVVLTADIVIALPGAEGTRSEIQLCLEYKKPVVILNINQVWKQFQGTDTVLVESLGEVYRKVTEWSKSI